MTFYNNICQFTEENLIKPQFKWFLRFLFSSATQSTFSDLMQQVIGPLTQLQVATKYNDYIHSSLTEMTILNCPLQSLYDYYSNLSYQLAANNNRLGRVIIFLFLSGRIEVTGFWFSDICIVTFSQLFL